MSRLTEKNRNVCELCGQRTRCTADECNLTRLYDKLAHYENLEEQGRLIELPCKVGDTVYKLWYKPCHKGIDYPDSYDCCGCEDDCTMEKAIFEFTVPSRNWILRVMDTFGQHLWFLTKEEAEAKLAEMKGE